MNKIYRANYNIYPSKLYKFSSFEEFLKNDTYLYLRTYGHEGSYQFNDSLSSFENMIQATIEFVDSVLTNEKLQNFYYNINESAKILPVHGFKYLGLHNKTYIFETYDISSNLMTILSTIKIHHFLGADFCFSCKQENQVSRNASSAIHRLASPNKLTADIIKSQEYIVFDDHIYSGSTVSNLVGDVIKKGGICETIMCLATNPIVKKLKLTEESLNIIKNDYVYKSLEAEWVKLFGFSYDGLTEVEATILIDNFINKNINILDEINRHHTEKYIPTYDRSLWPILSQNETYNSLSSMGIPKYGIKIINCLDKVNE